MRAWVGMLSGILTAIVLAAWSSVLVGAAPQSEVRTGASPAQARTVREFTNRYCITCHNGRLKTGGLELDKLELARVGPDAESWEKVARKLRAGMMPPAGARRPERRRGNRWRRGRARDERTSGAPLAGAGGPGPVRRPQVHLRGL